MEIIIEYEKKDSLAKYFKPEIKRPFYIAIGHVNLKDTYYLIYNQVQYAIDKSEVNTLMKTLNLVKVSQIPETGIGVDGETYLIRIINGWNSLEFKWWSDTCGEQWEGLLLFREKILELKDKYKEN